MTGDQEFIEYLKQAECSDFLNTWASVYKLTVFDQIYSFSTRAIARETLLCRVAPLVSWNSLPHLVLRRQSKIRSLTADRLPSETRCYTEVTDSSTAGQCERFALRRLLQPPRLEWASGPRGELSDIPCSRDAVHLNILCVFAPGYDAVRTPTK